MKVHRAVIKTIFLAAGLNRYPGKPNPPGPQAKCRQLADANCACGLAAGQRIRALIPLPNKPPV